MIIVAEKIAIGEVRRMAGEMFGNLVKAVVDVDRRLIALDAELHSDLEAFLLQNGSAQGSLWGINLYPEMSGDDFVEFDSLIDIRPSQGNRCRGVDSGALRDRIAAVIAEKVVR